jgi:calcineurin-like phosphoesterase family protein
MPEIFFTADEHYGHANIILPTYCNRPFVNVDDMTEQLIMRHNEKVTDKNSITYHLGDIFWKRVTPKQAKAILSMLTGAHCLILGNHDEIAKQISSSFMWVKERAQLNIEGQQIILDHYAGRVWNNSFHKSWQLYGHSHGQLPEDPSLLAFDVGVDCWNYYPTSWYEIRLKMTLKQSKIEASNKRVTEFASVYAGREKHIEEIS